MASKLEIKRIEFAVTKAKTAMEELELKILEKLEEIERIKHHIELQKEVIINKEEELLNL